MIVILRLAAVCSTLWVRTLLCVTVCVMLPMRPAASSEIEDALRLVEGDSVVASRWQQRGLGLSQGARVWPNGLVPFYIDEALDPMIAANIAIAVDEWNRVAGITLYQVSANARPVDYLHFQPGDGCASWVGFMGGAQEVWLSADCNAGSIMHEIGHTLGLEHEHTRVDRDQYIEIQWDNIYPEKRHNFDVAGRGGVLLGEYDYGSIMHYGLTHFSRNGRATIRAVQNTPYAIGQRNLPSGGDIDSVARLYASDIAIVTQLEYADGDSEITTYISNDHSQGAHGIVIEIRTGQAALAPSSIDDVYCVPVEDGADCRLDSLAGGATRIARLAFDGHLDDERVLTYVRSKTPDTNIDNNSGGVASEPALARAQQIYSDAKTGKVHAGLTGFPMLIGLLLLGVWRFRRRA